MNDNDKIVLYKTVGKAVLRKEVKLRSHWRPVGMP